MDVAMELAIEMSETMWNAFTSELKDLTPDEIHRRLLPQAINIAVIVLSTA